MHGFSWIESPYLSASAFPFTDDLPWLREHGIDLILTLTEDPLPKHEVDRAGLMSVHVPVADMSPPTVEQIEQCVAVIDKARESKMGVNVHCLFGRGRTGTVLAGYLISRGMSPQDAIDRIREMRPGSIETTRQEDVLHHYADTLRDRPRG